MVFEKQSAKDFIIQDTSAKRVIPHPNRLDKLNGQQNSAQKNMHGQIKDELAADLLLDESMTPNMPHQPIYSDLLVHLIQSGVVDIPENQEQNILEQVRNLDLELLEKKQHHLQDILSQYQQQQQEFEEAAAKSQTPVFHFDMRNQKLAKIKYLQAKKYSALLYILIWVTIILTAWVYTSPLPAAFIMKA